MTKYSTRHVNILLNKDDVEFNFSINSNTRIRNYRTKIDLRERRKSNSDGNYNSPL